MPIAGITSTLAGQPDLYKGAATKNKEEFSLETASAQRTHLTKENTSTSLVKTEENKKTFWDQLTNQVKKTSNETVAAEPASYEQRLNQIQKKGKILLEHPLPSVMKDYLSDVKSFLNDVRENAYSGKSEDGVFKKLDLADEKLEKLAENLLQEQKPELNLAASLGELQGLLIDIFV